MIQRVSQKISFSSTQIDMIKEISGATDTDSRQWDRWTPDHDEDLMSFTSQPFVLITAKFS